MCRLRCAAGAAGSSAIPAPLANACAELMLINPVRACVSELVPKELWW
jgi:hypothetical protein